MKNLLLASMLALLAACHNSDSGSTASGGTGPTFPPQGASIEVGDPFASLTIFDGGNLVLPEGWMKFQLSDGTSPVSGATFRFEQNDAAGGGVGLVKTVILAPGETEVTFAPYAPVTEGVGACGWNSEQLFDELPGTDETTWTVTATVPLKWYSDNGYPSPSELWNVSTSITFVPELLEARGPKFHRVIDGVPETGVFWHVWDWDNQDKLIGLGGQVHLFHASGEWAGVSPLVDNWYATIAVNEFGDFVMYPDVGVDTVAIVRDELGRYSRPVMVRVGCECKPGVDYVSCSYESSGWYDIEVHAPGAYQVFEMPQPPSGYTYSNVQCVVRGITHGGLDVLPVNDGVALWPLPLPAIGERWTYEVSFEAVVDVPLGSTCDGGVKVGAPYRFRVIGRE